MFLRHTYPALLWALLILILCLIPGNHIPLVKFIDWLKPDKIVHLVVFGVQSFLLIIGFQKQNSFATLSSNKKFFAVCISIFFGIFVEVLQASLPDLKRSGNIFDAVADAIGVFIGLWFFNYVSKRNIAKKVF